MIDDGGAVRIGIEDPVVAAVPDQSRGPVPDIAVILLERFRPERFRLHG
jgi:hypothetical protein